jgi:hypothetical protein
MFEKMHFYFLLDYPATSSTFGLQYLFFLSIERVMRTFLVTQIILEKVNEQYKSH